MWLLQATRSGSSEAAQSAESRPCCNVVMGVAPFRRVRRKLKRQRPVLRVVDNYPEQHARADLCRA